MLDSGGADKVALGHLKRAVAHNEELIARAPGDDLGAEAARGFPGERFVAP